jgi:hypothetical protein
MKTKKGKGGRVLSKPRGFHDRGWQEKIRIAEEARALGQELQKGKPLVFVAGRREVLGGRPSPS